MNPKKCFLMSLSVVLTVCLCASVGAEVHSMYFSAWTTNYPNPADQEMSFYFQISDTNLRAPDAITELAVLAPDGTLFYLTNDNWEEFEQYYWYGANAADFDSGVIPSGLYYARVTDLHGKQIIGSDNVKVNFMDPPVLTYPTNGSTVSSLTPTITWSKPPGAMRYRILLLNGTPSCRGIPIYWFEPCNPKTVYRNSFPIPKGVLKPGKSYVIRIEAHDSDKDRDNRSRTAWIQFYTP